MKALFALLQLNLGLVSLLAFPAALCHVVLLDLQSLFLSVCGLFLLLLFGQELEVVDDLKRASENYQTMNG
jgi:hypothetical protein